MTEPMPNPESPDSTAAPLPDRRPMRRPLCSSDAAAPPRLAPSSNVPEGATVVATP